jgi:hypothetical protein
LVSIRGKVGKSQIISIYGSDIIYLMMHGYHEIDKLDISRCVSLKFLECSLNNLTYLDLSNNKELVKISCAYNQLKSLDLSNNTKLIRLYCDVNNITSLDFSNNKELKVLECANNQLSSLNIENNEALSELFCFKNHLKSLNVKNNHLLKELYCNFNNLTFQTLPIVNQTSGVGYLPANKVVKCSYYYKPQYPLEVAKSIPINMELDLSSQYLVNGNITIYTWKSQGGIKLKEGIDYKIDKGKTIFLKPRSDKVYCEMYNASFPELKDENILKTSLIKIE